MEPAMSHRGPASSPAIDSKLGIHFRYRLRPFQSGVFNFFRRCPQSAGTTSFHSHQAAGNAVVAMMLPWPRSDWSRLYLQLIRIRLHLVQPVKSRTNFAGQIVAEQKVLGLPSGLHLRQQLHCGQRFLLEHGAGARDDHSKCTSTVYPSLFVLSSRSREIRRLSHLSASSSNAPVASGGTQTDEQLWQEYFADTSQWWDNRVGKRTPRSPDLKHKVTKEALWIDRSTPAWVKARLASVAEGRLQCHGGPDTKERLPKSSNGDGNDLPTDARESRQIVQGGGGGGSMHVRSARTTSEAIQILKDRLHQGIITDPYTYVDVLKRCYDTVAVKQVHDCIIQSGMDQITFVANNLLSAYIRCKRLQDAHRVFDGLVKKDVISWNMMIGGYAQHNQASEAMKLFHQMCREDVKADEITYLSILKACVSPTALKWGKEVHAQIRHAGLESDVRVGTALVRMYAKCGSIKEAREAFDKLTNRDVFSWNAMIGAYVESGNVDDARLVFDRMEKRNVVTWNVLIGGYAGSGHGEQAYELFLDMQREGFKPDTATFMSILKACASLERVKAVHGHALEAGLESDLRLSNALIHMYAKCGSMGDARLIFDKMAKRDVISWNAMIGGYAGSEQAYELFLQMKGEGFKPDAVTFMNILNTSASQGAMEWVKEVHGHVLEAGLESDLRVSNALIHMYAKCGSMDDAQLVFDRMRKRDVITWTGMIGGYAGSGRGDQAYKLFLNMKREGLKPDAVTFMSILNANEGAMEWVKAVHGHVLEAGLESDLRVSNALIHMYAKCGNMDDARVLFDRMRKRDVISWTVMIGGYAESGRGDQAYELFLQMNQDGFKPDAVTFISILNACASVGALDWVKAVHGHALEAGLESDLRVSNALIHMYAKCGSMDDARLVFDRMRKRDVISWTGMIGGLAQHGCGHEALEVFRNMIREGVKPDEKSFVAVLGACSHAGLVDEGRRLFLAMTQDYGIKPDVFVCSCMVDMLGRGGYLEEALQFVRDMPVEPDAATWGALLGACRIHGNVELAELAAEECLKLERDHAGTYVLLSNVYAAAGKWDQVSLVRTMMQERGIRKEPGRSWIEVDNKVHYFVVGDKSHPETKEIHAELNSLTERIKAEGYIPDTRLVLQNIDEEDKKLALCSHSEKLAIAYGLMRTPRGKPIIVHKNLRVCSDCHTATKFISKVTGREIVARDANRFHYFKDGVCSCGDYW